MKRTLSCQKSVCGWKLFNSIFFILLIGLKYLSHRSRIKDLELEQLMIHLRFSICLAQSVHNLGGCLHPGKLTNDLELL